MKGRLEKVNLDWMVFFVTERNNMKFERGLKVNPSQIPHLQTTISIMVENNGKQVDFEIIDDFAVLKDIQNEFYNPDKLNYSEGLINPTPPRQVYEFIKNIFRKLLYL